MKRSFLIFFLTMITSMVMAQSGQYKVNVQKLNVRSAPNSQGSKVVGSLTAGNTVTVKSITNGWAAISFNGTTCYVKASYLTKVEGKSDSKSQQNATGGTSVQKSQQRESKKQENESATTVKPMPDEYLENDKGFGQNIDVRLGYKSKVASVELDYDLGYRFNNSLYLGAGPAVSVGFGDGGNFVNVGGAGKLSYIFPVSGNVKPMIDLRGGYMYNLDAKDGDFFLGGDLGVNISKKFNVGISVVGQKATEVKVKKKKAEEYTKWQFTPQLFLTYELGRGGKKNLTPEEKARQQARWEASQRRKAKVNAFFKASFFEDEVNFGLGLTKSKSYFNDTKLGNMIGDNLTWNMALGKHWTTGPGIGFRKYYITGDGDSYSESFLDPFWRTSYTFGEVVPKLRPFIRLDLGVKMRVDGEEEMYRSFNVLAEPQLGVVYSDLITLSLGYHTTQAHIDERTVKTAALNLGIRF